MKILLLGEYSNLHWTIAEGLRKLGHDVTVASGGDRYKNIKRDVDLYRNSYNIGDTIRFGFNVLKEFSKFKGYDVVQIINSVFIDLRFSNNLRLFNYLKKHNKRVFLGAFGDDTFWMKACLDHKTYRYSEFYNGDKPIIKSQIEAKKKAWEQPRRAELDKVIADSCDGIIACLYEYHKAYEKYYPEKLTFIPEPVNMTDAPFKQRGNNNKVRFFIGIQTKRSEIKGTDVLYKVLKEVNQKYPDLSDIKKVESMPYDKYMQTMDESDILLDQLYSYTPAMNALFAMGRGLVVVGGGEPESYDILGETENKPVINVLPDEKDIFNKLEWLIQNKQEIPQLSLQSRKFIEKHHDYVKVAQQYIDFWSSKL